MLDGEAIDAHGFATFTLHKLSFALVILTRLPRESIVIILASVLDVL